MSEVNYNVDNIPTFVAVPIDALDNNSFEKSDQFRVIKNAIIKTLSDGSLCIIDANDCQQVSQLQLQVQNPFERLVISNVSTAEENETFPQKPQKPLYKCPKCKEVFEKVVSYRKHMMWHRQAKKYKCDKCTAGYNVETNLKIHMAMHNEGKPTCPICNISFQRLASLKSHLMIHQVEELYTCEECAAEFEKEEELNRHLQSHVNSNPPDSNNLVCSYCNVQFEDQKSYKEHISHHIKVKKMVLSGKKSRKTHSNKDHPHVCDVCLKSFSRISLLERHLRVHSGERPFVCEYCNRGFNQKGTLQIHLSKHTGVKPFKCTLCTAQFNQKGNLRVHVEKTHTAPMPGVKTYKCSHCTCIFKKVASLNVHITKSHANNEDLGSIPGVMTRLKELEAQTTVTPNMKPEERQVVEQNKKVLDEIKDGSTNGSHISYVSLAESFLDGTVRRYLVMQRRVNDVRWYICSYCSKEFKKPSDLIRHTRVHTREKPFMCKQCGASFSLKSTLFCHVKTHKSSSNYSCTICTKKFTSLRSANLHLRRHTDKQQYKCLTCNKSFSSRFKARLHNKDAHSKIELKQPLVETPNGLLPIAAKTQPDRHNPNKQFQCHICNARFSKMPNLNRHLVTHSGEKKFKCEQCHKSYYTAYALKEHLLYHAGVRNFGCKVCGKQYTTGSLLKRHMVSHSTYKPYVCPYCSKSFKSLGLCRKHMNVHKKEISLDSEKSASPDGETSCMDKLLTADNNDDEFLIAPSRGKVGESRPVEESSENNVQNQIAQQLYEIAPNSIQILTNSNKEIAQDNNQVQTIFINCEDLQLSDNLYTQNADAMLFNTLGDLPDTNAFSIDPTTVEFEEQNTEAINDEIIINNESVKLNKTKAEKSSLVLGDNVLSTNLYSHPDLNLLFNLDPEFDNNNLNLPEIRFNEVPEEPPLQEPAKQEPAEPLTCDKCDKLFPNKKAYTKHQVVHNRNQVVLGHACNFCGKGFKKQSDLTRHIRTHTGERPFACDKCHKMFSLKSTLLSHQRTHDPVSHKPYSCVVCNSFFSTKSSLKVHMSVHTGDKTHECSLCATKFRTAAHKKSHENNFHLGAAKTRARNKVTNLLASVAMDVAGEQAVCDSNLDNVLVVQEQMPFAGDQLNLLSESDQSAQLEPLILQQLQTNFLLPDNLLPPSFIQLDDGTLLNVKTVQEVDAGVGLSTLAKPRNLECDICHKKYASKDVLRKHKKIHGIDKKFRCTKCERGFDLEEQLKKHEKIHEGYRPFACFCCNNSFSKQHSLATHMKRIHNISLKNN